jgi:hypothetical protein
MPPSLSDEQVAELARQQASVDISDEQVMQMAQQQATQDVLGQGPQPAGPDFNEQYIRPAILPTGLGIAGGIAGTRLGGPWGGVAGAAAGSGIGEGINQYTGITEQSPANLAFSVINPLVIGGTLQAVKPLAAMWGAKGAQALNALAPEEAAASLAKLSPKIPSGTLFKQAAESQVKVPMNRTVHMIDDMLEQLTDVSKGVQSSNGQVIGYLKGLKNLLATNPTGVSPIALQRELEGAGNVIKSVNTKGGSGSGAIKQAFKAMVNDLDDAAKMANPSQPGATALIGARNTFKRESVLREIGENITEATKTMRGQGSDIQFNASAVLNKIKKNDFYKDALSGKEQGEIEGVLKMLNKIPALPPASGAQFGSGRFAQMVTGATAGGGMGFYSSGSEGAAIGAAMGAAIPPMAQFGKNFTTALQMNTGRALMKELLTQSKGTVTPQVASVIAAYAEAVRAGSVND